ncbi:hypothetical protein DACRYDRAFT_23148 [Dacryopinax primogenitus]|uniref:Transmembrane protein n=1 Tax=Dacryopinax primogenitus (strain DJM 731) TaxID=1858805 RepID=M5FYB7_DACPD|nr:uncharacterized protein DACRYDRAFT_23148 [Dacryopinax primogenitus]EJU00825.1 hypothetical protein DACRYDRAFT_23148 [Dacryopinax primogenitus]
MQFTRFTTTLLFVFAFFGLVAIAAPVPAINELEERCAFGCNDGAVVSILANLHVTVKADIAVVANLVAQASVDATLYTAVFATLIADINAAITLIAALPVSVVGLSAGLIASTCANIFIDIFVVINSCSSIPNIASCYGGLNEVLVALLGSLKVCLGNVIVSLIATLCVTIKAVISLSVNVDIFAGLSAVLFI